MNKGRPGITFNDFVIVWEDLLKAGQGRTNNALKILGGSKSTIIAFRERYERERSAKELNFLKSVELTEAVHRAIAEIKIKEIELLENENKKLQARIDEYLKIIQSVEADKADAIVTLNEAKVQHEIDKSKLERQLASTHARLEDALEREKLIVAKHEELQEQHNLAKQEAAVAKKEVEMLRDHLNTPSININ